MQCGVLVFFARLFGNFTAAGAVVRFFLLFFSFSLHAKDKTHLFISHRSHAQMIFTAVRAISLRLGIYACTRNRRNMLQMSFGWRLLLVAQDSRGTQLGNTFCFCFCMAAILASVGTLILGRKICSNFSAG